MKFTFIDYSDIYFERIKKTEKPRRRGGKFVQIINEATEKEYLVLSPKELSIYHANIIERFCMMQKIKGSYNSKKDYFTINDDDWVVVGGGIWVIDEDKRRLELSGASRGYGAFAAEGLKGKILGSGVLSRYSILVNGL